MPLENRRERVRTSKCARLGLDAEPLRFEHPVMLGLPGSLPVTTDLNLPQQNPPARVGAHRRKAQPGSRVSWFSVARELHLQNGGCDWHNPPDSYFLAGLSLTLLRRWTSIRAWQPAQQ